MNVRARIYFDEMPSVEMETLARVIHKNMSAHAALFPQPPVSMADFLIQINDFKAKLLARRGGGKLAINALREAHEAMADTLRQLGTYVNTVAMGRLAEAQKSGFPVYATRRTPNYAPPPAPQNLVLRHGKLSGTLKARHRPALRRSVNEVQICLGNPDLEENWTRACYARGCKADLENLPPGVIVWVRVRTLGLKGVFGPWSDPAQIRTL